MYLGPRQGFGPRFTHDAFLREEVGVVPNGVRLALGAGESRLVVAEVQNAAIDRVANSLGFSNYWAVRKRWDVVF